MLKHIFQFIIISTFFIPKSFGRDHIQVGGKVPLQPSHQPNCLTENERQHIMENSIDVEFTSRDTVMFHQPVGNGGMMNGDKNYITNYVDENPSNGWIEDYNCYFVTYDGHWGTDIAVSGFYYMDEMTTPILAAARGVVIYTHDGEFDRWTYWSNNAISNTVGLQHTDGTRTYYLHMKKNSVAVSLGDTVQIGDTLGFIGSSGFSDGPHLHFEVNTENWNLIDPWEGECGMGETRWVEQLPFIGDSSAYPQRVFRHLNTAYPAQNDDEYSYIVSENIPSLTRINPGESYMSLVAVRNLYAEDTLTWRWYKDGTFVDQFSFVPGQTQSWYQGAPYYATSYWWINDIWSPLNENVGEWEERIFINGTLSGQKSFICDTQPNQIPMVVSHEYDVELGHTITGEFEIEDDGDAFWFNLESDPISGGTVEVYGGRRRKFSYTAPSDYVGTDVIGVSAVDDRGVSGPMSFILFNITGIGLTNLNIESSYVPVHSDSVSISAVMVGNNEDIVIKAMIYNELSNVTYEQELTETEEDWRTYFTPEDESFFSVDVLLLNNDEGDTITYEDVGNFTSVGPLTISFNEILAGEPGSTLASEYSVKNQSDSIDVSDVFLLFFPDSSSCLENYSQNFVYLGDIGAGDSVVSIQGIFVAVLGDDCNGQTLIPFQAVIGSNQKNYWIENFEINILELSVKDKILTPDNYQLKDAYPNPFNPVTTIEYGIPEAANVKILVYSLLGQKVRILEFSQKEAGYYTTQWDGTNQHGESVSAGMYFYRFQTEDFSDTKKIILLK
ncbi:MAG: hypothetical protein CMG57_04335 [Candidatus Marinimicrobia bacterium]|nr:hypothetical protein [Candidatus Neomarinimicrobiota bacterium]